MIGIYHISTGRRNFFWIFTGNPAAARVGNVTERETGNFQGGGAAINVEPVRSFAPWPGQGEG
jgi:hypothetical protein